MHKPKFEKECRKVVYQRLDIRSRDIRLDPRLKQSCKIDIKKYCEKEMHAFANTKTFEELHGAVIHCLKKQYTNDTLTDDCMEHMRGIIIESNLNHHLDPILRQACSNTLVKHCTSALQDTDGEDGDGRVTECIKRAFIHKQIHVSAIRFFELSV